MHGHHLRVGVAEARVVEHDEGFGRVGGVGGGDGWLWFCWDGGDVAGLLLELAQGALGGGLVGVDEAGGHFDRDLVERGAELLLQEEQGAVGLAEDGHNAYAVGSRGGRAGLAGTMEVFVTRV